jgi:hypothetical protein
MVVILISSLYVIFNYFDNKEYEYSCMYYNQFLAHDNKDDYIAKIQYEISQKSGILIWGSPIPFLFILWVIVSNVLGTLAPFVLAALIFCVFKSAKISSHLKAKELFLHRVSEEEEEKEKKRKRYQDPGWRSRMYD